MARIEDGNLKGAVGNIVFYAMNGKTYARTKPGKRKKKRNALESPQLSVFKMVTNHGTAMLMQLKPLFLFPFKRDTYNLFRGWMMDQLNARESNAAWEVAVADTLLYNLNRDADLRNLLLILPEVSVTAKGKVSARFPSFIPANKIIAPIKTTEVNIKMIAVVAPFSGNQNSCTISTDNYPVQFDKQPAAEKEFVLNAGGSTGDMLFIIVGLEYVQSKTLGNSYLQNTKWLPAAIVAVGKL